MINTSQLSRQLIKAKIKEILFKKEEMKELLTKLSMSHNIHSKN